MTEAAVLFRPCPQYNDVTMDVLLLHARLIVKAELAFDIILRAGDSLGQGEAQVVPEVQACLVGSLSLAWLV